MVLRSSLRVTTVWLIRNCVLSKLAKVGDARYTLRLEEVLEESQIHMSGSLGQLWNETQQVYLFITGL